MTLENKPAHSPIGASSYYRWKACPASIRLSKGIVQPESSYAAEGTLAHEIGEALLKDYFFREGKPDIPPNYKADDLAAIKLYVETIKKDALAHGCRPQQDIQIEHRFDLSSVHPGLYGTSDCTVYSPESMKLFTYDYKHGQGIPVDVEENLQLQYYALGALMSMNVPCKEVEIVIVQPRCNHPDGPVRRWKFNSVDLIDFAGQLKIDAEETEKKDARIMPGDHCRFCPAAASKCEAIRDKAKALARVQFSPVQDYDEKKLTEALNFIPALEAWIKNVREFAYGEAQHGRTPPGYKLVAKRATRKWNDDEKKIAENLECLIPSQDFYTKKLMSPAQVEKILPKYLKKQLEHLVVKQSSGHTLVKDTDKRSEVKLDARSDFTAIGD